MSAQHQYRVLTNAYDSGHLIDQGKKAGISWQEDKNEGVNWMRFSRALVNYLEDGNDFHIDNAEAEVLQAMLDHYTQLRDLHKKTMIPQLRSTMSKLFTDKGDNNLRPVDLIKEAHEHLGQNGGVKWAEKVSTLSGLNKQVNALTQRVQSITPTTEK